MGRPIPPEDYHDHEDSPREAKKRILKKTMSSNKVLDFASGLKNNEEI
jgi:hypothetical protein